MARTAHRLHANFRALFNVQELLTCKINILIVIDDKVQGGFGDALGFHLGELIRILDDDPWSHVRFVVEKAHRQSIPDPGVLPGFRFDAHDLTRYDQIWLFGIERTVDRLSQQELKALSQFMDAGGGVFAAGDHQNLGFAMCAEVPRVRSMRRWHYSAFGSTTEPEAPDVEGCDRLDTLVDPPGSSLPDQIDAVPQRIRPRFYTRTLNNGILQKVLKYPHPVLCGSTGVIEYLPDHMHEGLCEVPADLQRSFVFDGDTFTEYPSVNGHQEVPEVIASAESHGTTRTEFGVLGAYNGHRVGVGRVLVDASWHHWFNINFQGFLAVTDPLSPFYDPKVVPQWEAIKAYFRNVGLWLAPQSTQQLLRHGGLLLASRSHDVLMAYRNLSEVRNPLTYFWQLGASARNALGRIASECQIVLWLLDLLDWAELPLDPWQQASLRPQSAPRTWIDEEQLEMVALGGAVDALLTSFGKDSQDTVQVLLDKKGRNLEQLTRSGAARAVDLLIRQSQERLAALQPLGERAAKAAAVTADPGS